MAWLIATAQHTHTQIKHTTTNGQFLGSPGLVNEPSKSSKKLWWLSELDVLLDTQQAATEHKIREMHIYCGRMYTESEVVTRVKLLPVQQWEWEYYLFNSGSDAFELHVMQHRYQRWHAFMSVQLIHLQIHYYLSSSSWQIWPIFNRHCLYNNTQT